MIAFFLNKISILKEKVGKIHQNIANSDFGVLRTRPSRFWLLFL